MKLTVLQWKSGISYTRLTLLYTILPCDIYYNCNVICVLNMSRTKPDVGSSNIKRFGEDIIAIARVNFRWFPPLNNII